MKLTLCALITLFTLSAFAGPRPIGSAASFCECSGSIVSKLNVLGMEASHNNIWIELKNGDFIGQYTMYYLRSMNGTISRRWSRGSNFPEGLWLRTANSSANFCQTSVPALNGYPLGSWISMPLNIPRGSKYGDVIVDRNGKRIPLVCPQHYSFDRAAGLCFSNVPDRVSIYNPLGSCSNRTSAPSSFRTN